MVKEEKLRKQLEETNTKLLQEKNDLFNQLSQQKEGLSDLELRAEKLLSQKSEIERQLTVRQKQICSSHIPRKVKNLMNFVGLERPLGRSGGTNF